MAQRKQAIEYGRVKFARKSEHGWFGFIIPDERPRNGNVQFHSRDHAKLVVTGDDGDDLVMEACDNPSEVPMLERGTDVVFIRKDDARGGGRAELWATEDEWVEVLARLQSPKD